MKQLDLLRKIVRETLEEKGLDEMARLATGYKLADNWEEAFASLPPNIQKSTRFLRVIDHLKDNPGAEMKDIALAQFGPNADTPAVNPQIRALLGVGVIEKTGYTTPKAVKMEPTGTRGRPKVTNDELKMMGARIALKFAKGDSSYTPEEIEYIQNLYNSLP
jgi:hypothetical protein